MDESWYYLGFLVFLVVCALNGLPRDWHRPIAAALAIEVAWYWWLQSIYVYGVVEYPAAAISAAGLAAAHGLLAYRFHLWPGARLAFGLVAGSLVVIPLTLYYRDQTDLAEVYDYKFWRNGAAILRYITIITWAGLLWYGQSAKGARER